MNAPGKAASLVEIAAWVATALAGKGIRAVLVGGAAVSFHSANRYVSLDVDLSTVAALAVIEPVLRGLGFTKTGRVWRHSRFEPTVDIVAGPPAVGNLTLTKFARAKTVYGTVDVCTPTQTVMDRLAAYYHWKDPQSLEQAVMVAKRHRVRMKEIEAWSKGEGHPEGYRAFRAALQAASRRAA